ncbi:MAG: hypothetical protein LBM08_13945 [Dysgonamonadaceae bacterium]|jgi:hypothetical protein|nr:hypothetical protein [Dysgonamonadaceae bacterium]
MAGGHFDYQQYKINEIADSIEREHSGRKSHPLEEEKLPESYQGGL